MQNLHVPCEDQKEFLVSLTLMILVGTVFDLAIFERDAFYFFFLEP